MTHAAQEQVQDLTPRYDIKLVDRLIYRGASWTLTQRRGGELDFLDPRNGEQITRTDEELGGLISLGEAKIMRGNASQKDQEYAAASADLAMLSGAAVADARRIMAYTDELKLRGMTYRPATPEVLTAIAYVARRIHDPQPPAPYLVKRWLKKGDARAAAGGRVPSDTSVSDYIPQHGFKGNRTSRVCFEVSKIIHQVIEEVYLTPERRSVATLLSIARHKVRLANDLRAPEDQLKLPGRTAIDNAIKSLPRDDVLRKRHGADKAYDAVGPVHYRTRPEQPLDEIEMDHTTCDLFLVDGLTGAPLGRPTIVIGVDRCTAMPWGMHVGFDPPSVHTVMQCMRNGLLPKTYVRHYADNGVWDINGSWPTFGRPRKLSVDRGAENINHDMQALGVDLPIKEIEAKAGRKGRLKGGIERMLGTLNRTLLQEQRGTTFSNVVARDDYDPRKNAVLSYEELLERLHLWLIDDYMRRYHHGIRDIPIKLWNKKIASYMPRQVENVEKLLPLFGRIEHRTLRRDGIRWKHLFYISPDLMALLSNPDFLKASRDVRGDVVVRFRYDSSNIDHIHVYLPHARGQQTMHLRVPVEARSREYARGLSVWAHNSIDKTMRDAAIESIDVPALDAAKAKLIAGLDRDTPGALKIRGAARIARIRQIGGIAPFGDSIRTTPVGSPEDERQRRAVEVLHSSLVAHAQDEAEMFEASQIAQSSKRTGRQIKRGRDPSPATARKRARPSSRARVATPSAAAPSAEDDFDFYSDEVKA